MRYTITQFETALYFFIRSVMVKKYRALQPISETLRTPETRSSQRENDNKQNQSPVNSRRTPGLDKQQNNGAVVNSYEVREKQRSNHTVNYIPYSGEGIEVKINEDSLRGNSNKKKYRPIPLQTPLKVSTDKLNENDTCAWPPIKSLHPSVKRIENSIPFPIKGRFTREDHQLLRVGRPVSRMMTRTDKGTGITKDIAESRLTIKSKTRELLSDPKLAYSSSQKRMIAATHRGTPLYISILGKNPIV